MARWIQRFGSRLDNAARFGSRALRTASRFGSRAVDIGSSALAVGAPIAEAVTGGAATPFIAGAAAGLAGLAAGSRAAGFAADAIDAGRAGARSAARGDRRGVRQAVSHGGGSLRQTADALGEGRSLATQGASQVRQGTSKFRRSHLEAG